MASETLTVSALVLRFYCCGNQSPDCSDSNLGGMGRNASPVFDCPTVSRKGEDQEGRLRNFSSGKFVFCKPRKSNEISLFYSFSFLNGYTKNMKRKITWITDIHLDHLFEVGNDPKEGWVKVLSEERVQEFCKEVLATDPNFIVITGDISTAQFIELHLMWLEKYIPKIPIYFVLGNHDYYYGSISEVRVKMQKYNGVKTRLQWLPGTSFVQLTEKTALVGHDGWYDGGYSDWFRSKLGMPEYTLTSEFQFQSTTSRYQKLIELATECAVHIDQHVTAAARAQFEHVIFATHVPPFRENSRAPNGALSDPNWLPNMSSKIAGDALLRVAEAYRKVKFTCLCGHTHTRWTQTYGCHNNLVCMTGQSDHQHQHPELSIQTIEIE